MNFIEHIEKHIDFSEKTFGPGPRTQGITKHIEKELDEVRKDPTDLFEWIDIITLGIDGAWRSGHSAQRIAEALSEKLEKNIGRTWPDWRTMGANEPIEHVRTHEGN